MLTLGEFRKVTKDLPDDTLIMAECEEALQYNELSVRWLLEPVLEHGWAVLLEPGQIWNYELNLDDRIDAKLDLGGLS